MPEDNIKEMTPRADEIRQFLEIMFHTNGKGVDVFQSVEAILKTQAFFPNLDFESAVYLWKQCQKNKFEPGTISRLSTFENKGFKIKLENTGIKNIGIRLQEYSNWSQSKVYRTFFDISHTDMPITESRQYKIKKFTLNERFATNCFQSFEENTGFKLKPSKDKKISIDYDNKVIFYQANDELRVQFESFLKAVATFHYAPTKQDYARILDSQTIAKEARTQVTLTINSILGLLNLGQIAITPEYKKEYRWGDNFLQRYQKLEKISTNIASIVNSVDLEKHFNIEFSEQQKRVKREQIRKFATSNINYESMKEELYAETDRVKKAIHNRVDILEVIEYYDSANVKKAGANYKAMCPSHDDTNPSLSIKVSDNYCKCFSCNFGGDIFDYTMKVEKNLQFNEVVDLLAARYGIQTFYEDIKNRYKDAANRKTPREMFLEQFPDESPQKIHSLGDIEFYEYAFDKRSGLDKNKVYSVKEPRKTQERAQEITSSVKEVYDVNKNFESVQYLAKERGITKYPKELKYIIGEYKLKDGNVITYKGIGYVNRSGGADIRFPRVFAKEESHKKTRSVGPKDIVILNEHNLKPGGTNIIIPSESGWDVAAFYNQPKFKSIIDKAVVVVGNGASNLQKMIEFINQNKNEDTILILLTQADTTNQNYSYELLLQTENEVMQEVPKENVRFNKDILLKTAIQRYVKIEYSDEEYNRKADVNDLHLDGIDLSTRLYGSCKSEVLSMIEDGREQHQNIDISTLQDIKKNNEVVSYEL